MREPLSSSAFVTAVSLSTPNDRLGTTLPELLFICSNLIVLDSELDTVRFAHAYFQEYLEKHLDFDVVQTNEAAAIACASGIP